MIALVLHKVDGQPALDVATQVDDEVWVSTAGHRIYPYRIYDVDLAGYIMPVPADWPEHFQTSRHAEPTISFNVAAFLASIGPKFHRRY